MFYEHTKILVLNLIKPSYRTEKLNQMHFVQRDNENGAKSICLGDKLNFMCYVCSILLQNVKFVRISSN